MTLGKRNFELFIHSIIYIYNFKHQIPLQIVTIENNFAQFEFSSKCMLLVTMLTHDWMHSSIIPFVFSTKSFNVTINTSFELTFWKRNLGCRLKGSVAYRC